MQWLDYTLIVGAYLLGSLSSAIIVCRLAGLPDPRTLGSNNPGATNVLRFGGKKAAAITLAGDTLKGVLPVLLGRLLEVSPESLALIGAAAFLGHLYPVFFAFHGGKGVATALGVFAALSWQVGIALVLTWLVVAKVFRISSLAALSASILAPLYVWWLSVEPAWLVMSFIVMLLLVWRHRGNIRRLLGGGESAIGKGVNDSES